MCISGQTSEFEFHGRIEEGSCIAVLDICAAKGRVFGFSSKFPRPQEGHNLVFFLFMKLAFLVGICFCMLASVNCHNPKNE